MDVLKFRENAESPWQTVVALKGEPGEKGEPGKDGVRYTAGTNIEITEDNVINCTVEGGGGGTLTEELDPTVPSYVKGITEEDISKWNNKSEFDGDYNSLSNQPTIPEVPKNISAFTNDAGYIDHTYVDNSIQETCVSKEQYREEIDAISTELGRSLTEVMESMPTKTSQLTNDSGFINDVSNLVDTTTYIEDRERVNRSLASMQEEIDKNHNYDTSETIIGTWLGKPLYRKVLNVSPNAQNNRYNHNITNFKNIVKAYGRLHRSDGLQQVIPATYTNWEIWLYDFDTTSFNLRFSANQWNSGISNLQIVLEYTKTTD